MLCGLVVFARLQCAAWISAPPKTSGPDIWITQREEITTINTGGYRFLTKKLLPKGLLMLSIIQRVQNVSNNRQMGSSKDINNKNLNKECWIIINGCNKSHSSSLISTHLSMLLFSLSPDHLLQTCWANLTAWNNNHKVSPMKSIRRLC